MFDSAQRSAVGVGVGRGVPVQVRRRVDGPICAISVFAFHDPAAVSELGAVSG